METKILVFGNPLVEEDSLALMLIPLLQKKFPRVEFKEFDAAENLETEGRDLIVLDTAIGITKVTLLEDLGILASGKIYSMHDFDLGLSLKLLKKMDKIDSVRIIAVPSHFPLQKACDEAVSVISTLLSKNASHSSCRDHKRG